MEEDIKNIVGTFIALKYDADVDEYADGTKQRWDKMIEDLMSLITVYTAKARYRELVDLGSKYNGSKQKYFDHYEYRYKFLKNVIESNNINE